MKVWVTPPGKPPRPAEILAKGEGNLGWKVEEGDCVELPCFDLLKLELFPTISIPGVSPAKVGQREMCEICKAEAAAITL